MEKQAGWDGDALCDRFGTPGQWLVLGPLANPFVAPAFAAPRAVHGPLDGQTPVYGRDGIVRWFRFASRNPLGEVQLRAAFDGFKTDNASVHLVSNIRAVEAKKACLWLNWDDGIRVWINGKLVADHLRYPERGHSAARRRRPRGTRRRSGSSVFV